MNYICNKFPCGMNSGGCSDPSCPNRQSGLPGYPVPGALQPLYPLSPQMGCICPPGANKECENPACPRKPLRISATGNLSAVLPSEGDNGKSGA